jgi:DNA-binding response OmpR family regulator
MAQILVVDDDRSIRRTLEKFLSELHYQIDTAADGMEAYEKIVATSPDVILLDINLPGMDGLSLLEKLRAEISLPPIIMISARGDMRSTIKAIQLVPMIF